MMVAAANHIRSTIPKSAMMFFKAAFRILRRNLDSELEAIVPTLINKVGERSFLADEADEVLKSICDNASESRCARVLTRE